MNFSDKDIDQLMIDIYNGVININKLPYNLYLAISEYLASAFNEFENKPSKALLEALTTNINLFSQAKVYSQINDISLLAENELIKSFADFKKEALAIYDQYNKNWLQTEYSTTVAQGQNAVRWEQIENKKKTLPYLEYVAVMDGLTSDICQPLNGIILPVESSFWNSNAPANHFNCRCVLIQHDKEDATDIGISSKENADEINTKIQEFKQPMFNDNVGKSKQIFPENHPYFTAQNGNE